MVVLAALAIGFYFRSAASNDLRMIVHGNNESLVQGYVNSVWNKHKDTINKLQNIDIEKWQNIREFRQFSEDSFKHFEGVSVAALNIYNINGVKFLSTDQTRIKAISNTASLINIENIKNEQKQAFLQAKDGFPHAVFIPKSEIMSSSGKLEQASVIQSFIPIIDRSNGQKKINAVIEIFYNITPQWQQIFMFQIAITSSILGIFFLLMCSLYYTSRKSEKIIVRQHEKNTALKIAAAEAETANKQKSEFLANISHELRTPLNAIIGFSEMMKNEAMGPVGNEQYSKYITDIHSSGVHLLSLINDILDFSKAEAGKLELELGDCDVTRIIKTSARLVLPRAEAAGVALKQNVPKEHYIINTDAKKLKQILLNLLSNSVKFTPQGGEITISIWQNVSDGSLGIEVKDSGIGMAPKDIPKAMSPFGQVDSELSRKYDGTGLGLPLTKKLVELMGGTFTLKSELNVGTTISFTLPKQAPQERQKKGANISKPPQPAQSDNSKAISPVNMSAAVQPIGQQPVAPPISQNISGNAMMNSPQPTQNAQMQPIGQSQPFNMHASPIAPPNSISGQPSGQPANNQFPNNQSDNNNNTENTSSSNFGSQQNIQF